MSKRSVELVGTRICSDEFGVSTLVTRGGTHRLARKTPCAECPWRKDAPLGAFPAEAFRQSALTAYDAAPTAFACHMSGHDAPAVCAGFVIAHGENNLSIRLSQHTERLDTGSISDGGLELFENYREMAVANGVASDDPALKQVRGKDDQWVDGSWTARRRG